jgi:hypothetical protein
MGRRQLDRLKGGSAAKWGLLRRKIRARRGKAQVLVWKDVAGTRQWELALHVEARRPALLHPVSA